MISFKRSTDNIPSAKITFSIIAVISIFAFITNASFTIQQNNNLYHSKLESIKQQVQHSFQQSVDGLDNQFQILIAHYASMQKVTDAISQNERQKLFDLVKNDYRQLKVYEPHLSVMHFLDTENVTILRMHKPQSFGDDLTDIRPIVAYVNRSQQQASGFEPGKNGITYRITTPIFDADSNHIGALEFGIKPEFFIEALKERFAIKSQILVKTEALQHLTYQTDFEQIGDFSVVYKDTFFNDLDIDFEQKHQFIEKADKTYLVISDIYLNTYDGKELVRFQILEDVSEFHDKFNHQLNLYIVISIAFVLVFLFVLYFIFNIFVQHIANAFNQLKVSQGKERAIQIRSRKDDLTNAYNRRHFNVVMNDLLNDKALLEEHTYSIIFFDIDHFKKINDEYGHLTGDEVLKSLSKLVINLSRVDDLFFRWGGEEFCLVMVDTPVDKAHDKAEFLRERVQRHDWPIGLKLTISLGVTQIRFDDDLQSLQLRVDSLLYRAKEEGRNRTVAD